jgi:dolichyl-phosphate beta-glucosyltransferase
MDISVVIPCYNEEQIIRKNILEVYRYLKRNKKIKKFQIIVVDDGSTDNSYEIISSLKKEISVEQNNRRNNFGKGYSIKEGILMSKYSYVLFFDADLATPVKEINKFLIQNDYDVVIGSRRNINSKRNIFRGIFGIIFSFVSNLILSLKVSDPQCGIKMFNTEKAKKIFNLMVIGRFAFDSEVVYLARKLGYSIKEIPVRWKESKSTKVRPFRDGFKMLVDLFKIRTHDYGII